MIAALYSSSGKIVTGHNHGDAYEKLTDCEKNQELQSGFIDEHTLKFIADNCEFYLKKIILVRHGESDGEDQDGITIKGKNQVKLVANFFTNMQLEGFIGFCSPLQRCIDTAELLENYCNIHFSIHQDLKYQNDNESNEHFFNRVNHVLENLPERSLLISHCDFIKVMTRLIEKNIDIPEFIPNCSTTYIDNNNVIWLAKENPQESL